MKILNIVGARPNFMKIAPIMKEMADYPDIFAPVLVHTGQHYDEKMSKLFFDDLQLPQPDIYLGVGSGSHAQQTARIMTEFEAVALKEKPDRILVVGDVNSTIACALVASKLQVPTAHIEAGLRSFDRAMPEEINRILTDQIADMLFITENSAERNLLNEGVKKEKIHFVGNVMIDSLVKNLQVADGSNILQENGFEKGGYSVITLHRPSNVDHPSKLAELIGALDRVAADIPVIFPIHPRTRKNLVDFKITPKYIRLIDPVGYLDFLKLMKESRFVMTDSGGIQEETTYLGIPCLTLRENTERPVTVEQGTNILLGTSSEALIREAAKVLSGQCKTGSIPELWDGKAACRIVDVLKRLFQ